MRQLTCVEAGHLEWRDVPEPALESDREALVRPLAVARCDIDLPLATGGFPLRGSFALGHESVAEVIALGDAVRALAVGQRVVVAFQVSCGECGQCGRGLSGLCEQVPVLSDYGMQPLSGVEYGGMFSDVLRVPYAEAMLRPIPANASPTALASVSDNVLDGYRAVAPHLAERSGSDVLVVSHGGVTRSIPLYAVLAAKALGAGAVDFVSDDVESLRLAETLGARTFELDLTASDSRPSRVYPIVVDAGARPEGLRFALRATEPEGVCHCVSYYPDDVALPLGRLYTLGIRFLVGRCHAVSELPAVLDLIAEGRLAPERVTTRTVDWDDAAEAWLEPSIKLVCARRGVD